jgi:hypothetical protein
MGCRVGGVTTSTTAPTAPAPSPDPAVEAARAVLRETLARVARQLDDVAEVQARSARSVRDVWRGPHRDRFDAERARRDAELAGLAAACRLLAGR